MDTDRPTVWSLQTFPMSSLAFLAFRQLLPLGAWWWSTKLLIHLLPRLDPNRVNQMNRVTTSYFSIIRRELRWILVKEASRKASGTSHASLYRYNSCYGTSAAMLPGPIETTGWRRGVWSYTKNRYFVVCTIDPRSMVWSTLSIIIWQYWPRLSCYSRSGFFHA